MEESTGPRPQADNRKVAIRVVGLGGAGINAINRMADAKLQGVEFVSIDTDGSELERSKADKKIALSVAGQEVSGPKPNPGSAAKAAQEHEGEIEQALQGSDMVFITCGEGGGTGTGASPLVAHIAKEMGALTVAVVTRPFSFEGARRSEVAEKGIEKLKKEVDAIIVISGNRPLKAFEKGPSFPEAFSAEDDAVLEAAKGVLWPLQDHYVSAGFGDVKSVLENAGTAFFGTGWASGEAAGVRAAQNALNSDFVEESPRGARKALALISGSKGLDMSEISSAMNLIKNAARPGALVISGLEIDDSIEDGIKVTVIASGF